MLNKNDKLIASYLNNLKNRLNTELAKRGGQGSVYGYQDKISIAQINETAKVDEWVHTAGTDINNGIGSIESNTHYMLSSEINDLENKIAEWETRKNYTEKATDYGRVDNVNTTTETGCNTSCTGLCSTACFSGCTGTCQVNCASTCAISCSGGCKNSNSGGYTTSGITGTLTSSSSGTQTSDSAGSSGACA